MDGPMRDPREERVADLIGTLVEDGRAYARAEVDLLKQIARHRAGRARNGAVLLAAGAVLLSRVAHGAHPRAFSGLPTDRPRLAGLAVAAVLAITASSLCVRACWSGRTCGDD